MFVAPPVSYPGIYVQEVPSDVRTIVGVDTATTAFIGRARRGPDNTPMVLNNYADFERIFGGQWLKSSLGYAVNDFFQNGGAKAIVVRIFNQEPGVTEPGATEPRKITGQAQLDANGLALEAKYAGSWGNALAARITYLATDAEVDAAQNNTPVPPEEEKAKRRGKLAIDVAARYSGVSPKDLFTLTVRDLKTGATETFENVTANTGPRQIKDVLAHGSELVQVKKDATVAERPKAHEVVPSDGLTVWDDPAIDKKPTSSKVTDKSGTDGVDLDSKAVEGNQALKTGIYALDKADIFNILCIPPFAGSDVSAVEDVTTDIWSKAAAYCLKRRAMLLVDPPKGWNKNKARDGVPLPDIGPHTNAALYFPHIKKPNPLRDNQIEEFVPCGTIAGIMARTDSSRGVWKAPAGLDATLNGVFDLQVPLTDAENGELNPLGVNCLRKMPAAGNVVWGARTLAGDDRLASQWKYIPVRRTALFIEETIYRNIQWAVFEPNDEPLWAQLRLNIGVFMHDLYRQGAFQGQSPKDAYFVKCDATTTTQADIDKGIVNVVVAFAPLKPAEFVVVYIQQIAGQLAV